MTQLIDASYCADKSAGYCPAQNAACAGGNCGGAVLSSGLTVAPGACSWDRNSECKTSTGAAGGKCTCNWTIPAGAILQCGCGCK